MNPDEATAILALLSAGFPRQEWADTHKRLWRIELAAVGAHEGMAVAREVIRNHEFLSFKVFFEELAHVREHHSDRQRNPNLTMTACWSRARGGSPVRRTPDAWVPWPLGCVRSDPRTRPQ